jgi:hypothetical protein
LLLRQHGVLREAVRLRGWLRVQRRGVLNMHGGADHGADDDVADICVADRGADRADRCAHVLGAFQRR